MGAGQTLARAVPWARGSLRAPQPGPRASWRAPQPGRPRDQLSQLPASQTGRGPPQSHNTQADGLTATCSLGRHRGLCPSNAAAPRLAGARAGYPQTRVGTHRTSSVRHRGPGELTRPRQTGHAPKTAGHGVRRPGQAPPAGAGSEGRGGGKAAAGRYLGGGHLTPPSACFLICKMGELLSAPQGRCEGQMEDTRQRPARGLPWISQGAWAPSPDPARTGPPRKLPARPGRQAGWSSYYRDARGRPRGCWLLTTHLGRCPKSTCEPGAPGPVHPPLPHLPTVTHALQRPGLQGQRNGVSAQPALTSCVTCSSLSLRLPIHGRGDGPTSGTERTTPEPRVPNTH